VWIEMTDESSEAQSDLLRGDEMAEAVIASRDAAGALIPSGLSTAKKALEMLVASHGFIDPDRAAPTARKNIARAFAGAGKVVYGKAFDAIKVLNGAQIDFQDLDSVEQNLSNVILYEIKSTNRKALPASFAGYFFSLSIAELLVAQSLAERFKFVLVNTASGVVTERTLQELFQQVKSIYPGWSITLGAPPA
jgi:hypothetical protein